jgi:transposase-like protein
MVTKKRRIFSQKERSTIVRLYSEGNSCAFIARQLGARETSVRNVVKLATAEISGLESRRTEGLEEFGELASSVAMKSLRAVGGLLDESLAGSIEPRDTAQLAKVGSDLQRVAIEKQRNESTRELNQSKALAMHLQVKLLGYKLQVVRMSDLIIAHATSDELAVMEKIAANCEARAQPAPTATPRKSSKL